MLHKLTAIKCKKLFTLLLRSICVSYIFISVSGQIKILVFMVDRNKLKNCNNERFIFQWKIKTKELVCSTVEIEKARNEAMLLVQQQWCFRKFC